MIVRFEQHCHRGSAIAAVVEMLICEIKKQESNYIIRATLMP
jgi:hypothetical protein